jgi:hypothetical protein
MTTKRTTAGLFSVTIPAKAGAIGRSVDVVNRDPIGRRIG